MLEFSRSKAFRSFLTAATIVSLLLLAVFFSIRQLSSPDIGFHVKSGEWILTNLRFPTFDAFTYTVSAHEYVDTYWMYQIVVAAVHTIAGEAGIVLSNTLLLVGSFLVLVARMKRYIKFRESVKGLAVVFLAIFAMAVIFEPRPHSFSWLYLNLILWILEEHVDGNSKSLVFLPLVMLFWVNTQPTFILGSIVIGCYWIGSVWERRRIPFRLTAYFLGSMIVTFLNPYGWKGVVLPFTQVQFLMRANVFKGAIAEYASPLNLATYHVNGAFVLFQPLLGFHIYLIVLILVFLFNVRRLKLQEILLFVAFLLIGLSAVKNIGYCIFATAPLIVKRRWNLMGELSGTNVKGTFAGMLEAGTNWRNTDWIHSISNAFLIVLSFVLILTLATDRYYINFRSNERFGLGYNNLTLPYRASLFLRDHHLEGKILNHFNFGGFLIKMISQKIAADGRNEVMGEQFYSEFSDLWNANAKGPILEKFQPDIIIFPPLFEFDWVDQLGRNPSWRLVYVDEVAAIYLRNGYAPDIPTFEQQDILRIIAPVDESKINSVLKRSDPGASSIWSLTRVYFPQREISLSTFCFYNGWFGAACQVALNGIEKSTVACPELYYDLGNYFFEMRQANRAEYCYTRFLKTNSDDLALERVKVLRQILSQSH